jgi:hypothetical protein
MFVPPLCQISCCIEISKIYGVIESVSLSLEGGQLIARVFEAPGHCHKVWGIYQNHLERWFHQVLVPQETQEMESLFKNLNSYDLPMDFVIVQLSEWLVVLAQVVCIQFSIAVSKRIDY